MDAERIQRRIGEHPRNRLYRGETTSLEAALPVVISQCYYEHRLTELLVDEDPTYREEFAAAILAVDEYREAAERCLAEYHQHVRPLYEQWAASPNEHVRRIGEAALARDYARLAV